LGPYHNTHVTVVLALFCGETRLSLNKGT